MTASTTDTESTATAAASGANATERFQRRQVAAPPRRRRRSASTLLAREVHRGRPRRSIRKHKVTYDEYDALKAWLIRVGRGRRVAAVPRRVARARRRGGRQRGPRRAARAPSRAPTTCPAHPSSGATATLPMRDDEAGTPLLFQGQVTDVDGTPLPGAKVEHLARRRRRLLLAVRPGHPRVEPARHASSPTPTAASPSTRCSPRRTRSRPTARAASSSPRPAGTPGAPPTCTSRCRRPATQLITTQLYFPGDEHNDDDIASAVKPELILDPQPRPTARQRGHLRLRPRPRG